MSENQIIRKAWARFAPEFDLGLAYYNDKRVHGRRKVFKTFNNSTKVIQCWRKVLRSIRAQGVKGWKLQTGFGSFGYPWSGIAQYVDNRDQVSVG